MKVTVVTVCFNSEATIEQTIESVLGQSSKDYEYLIVDGASKDNTLNIIDKYSDCGIRVVSEEDEGLYDAMNKAADLAEGDFIIYMNSGDVFADSYVLEDIEPYLNENVDLIYGGTIRVKPEGDVTERYSGSNIVLRLLLQGKMMCHQSVFTRTEVMRKYGFDKAYTITADYDFIARMAHDKRKMVYVDRIVSKVDNVGGISSAVRNMDTMRRQDDMSLKKNFPGWYMIVTPPKALIRVFGRMREKKALQK